MDASQLDQRVTFERKRVARDADFNTEVPAWVSVAPVWAKVADEINIRKGGDESVDQNVRVQRSRTQITIRYRAGITSDMRVQWFARGRLFQITSIAEVGRREWLELSCEEYSA